MQVDSRRIEEGDLFFAVDGGEDFTRHAFARGAAATLVPEDAFAGIAALGSAVRGRSSARVVGITGSTGKTSTKDILAAMCRPHAKTVAAEGGHNNEIGLPLTLTRIEPDTEVVVCEMGMRGIGQIAELCAIARPDIGVITSIGPVHLELLGTVEKVAEAKAEVVASLPAGRSGGRSRRAAARAVPRPRRHRDPPLRPGERRVVRAHRRRQPGRLRPRRRAARARVPVHRASPGAERGRRPARGPGARSAAARGQGRGRALALARRGVTAPRRRPADQRLVQREPGLDAGRARAPGRARRPQGRGPRRHGRAGADGARVPPRRRRARPEPRHRRSAFGRATSRATTEASTPATRPRPRRR